MFDGKAFGEEIVGFVRDYLEREVTPLKAENAELKERLKALEDRPAPEKGEPGERGADGESPDPEVIAETFQPLAEQMIADAVAKAVSDLPPPEPGPPGEKGERGEPGEKGADGQDGADGRDGADGSGIADLLRDHEGNLVASFTDGRLKNLGPIQGKDGKDGRDGFGFEDLDACVLDDDRTIELSFRRGDEEKAFTFKWPTCIYRNVFREGEQYERGDMVTWAGSLWHCDTPTKDKPGTESWTLAAKKGRDGKDAK